MSTTQQRVKWAVILFQGVLLISGIVVVLTNIRVSPGELTAVHAREARLEGSAGCKECHGESRHQKHASACGSCHADILSQVDRQPGFHGTLPEGEASDCGRCHGEHQGRAFASVNRRSFELSGIPEEALFAHEKLDFHLSGRHLSLECTTCHRHADAKELPKGEKRYLGLDQTCTRCHKDVHEGAFGPACQACHGQVQSFASVALFRHPEAFPLTGAHAGIACASCHEPGTLQKSPVGSTPAVVRGCVSCHRSPHGDAFLSKTGLPVGLAAADSCVRCHVPEKGAFRGPRATVTPRQHAALGFPLTPPHQALKCSACHADYGKALPGDLPESYHRRYPGRTPDDCRACHRDPHRGEFEGGAFKGRDCLSCHTRQAFSPPEFDMAKHDLAFKLEGRHRKLQCNQCHVKTEEKGPRDYRGVPVDCRSCHQDPHGGQFDKPIYLGGDCRSCHAQNAWRPPTFTVEMHRKTSFELTGAHVAISCTRCHEAIPSGGKPCPRKFSGVSAECASCHQDVHAGKFDGPGRPATTDGRKSCARCHGTDTFRGVASRTFDHSFWTGYALAGAHAKIACAACHGRTGTPDARGRTLGVAAGTSCQTCHSDPHAGQFGPTASVNCASCHREEGTFRSLRFDHQKGSRFPLDELHSKIACAACHKPMPVGDGVKSVRYKPLGTKCGDCHDPRGPR
jgi:hypothetical protein